MLDEDNEFDQIAEMFNFSFTNICIVVLKDIFITCSLSM